MASEFPALFTIQWMAYSGEGEDAHGNTVDVWAAPADRQVIGWGSPSTTEPKLAGHNRDVVEIELLVPSDWASHPRDRGILPDLGQVEQIGKVESTAGNPFGWVPGHIVNLRQVNG